MADGQVGIEIDQLEARPGESGYDFRVLSRVVLVEFHGQLACIRQGRGLALVLQVKPVFEHTSLCALNIHLK